MPTLGVKDAEYLEKYLGICDKLLSGRSSLTDVNAELETLNKEFKDEVCGKTLKDSVMGSNLTNGGWVPSEICW